MKSKILRYVLNRFLPYFRARGYRKAVRTIVPIQWVHVARVRVQVADVRLRVRSERPNVQFASNIRQSTRRAIPITSSCGMSPDCFLDSD